MKIEITRQTFVKGVLAEVGDILDVDEKTFFVLVKETRKAVEADPGIITKTPTLKDMTVAKLKELLDKLEVDYDFKAKKCELVELVEENTEEPPDE